VVQNLSSSAKIHIGGTFPLMGRGIHGCKAPKRIARLPEGLWNPLRKRAVLFGLMRFDLETNS